MYITNMIKGLCHFVNDISYRFADEKAFNKTEFGEGDVFIRKDEMLKAFFEDYFKQFSINCKKENGTKVLQSEGTLLDDDDGFRVFPLFIDAS